MVDVGVVSQQGTTKMHRNGQEIYPLQTKCCRIQSERRVVRKVGSLLSSMKRKTGAGDNDDEEEEEAIPG